MAMICNVGYRLPPFLYYINIGIYYPYRTEITFYHTWRRLLVLPFMYRVKYLSVE